MAMGWISEAKSFMPMAQAIGGKGSVVRRRMNGRNFFAEEREEVMESLLIEYTIANTKIVIITTHLAPPYVACTLFVAYSKPCEE